MEGQPHSSTKNCRYQHQFDNKQLLCERCFQEGRRIVVKLTSQPSNENAWIGLASRAWYGSVIECPTCGEIFRQFKHWYGNKTPEEEAVRTQIVHVWNTDDLNNGNASYSAQMLVNGVSYLSGVVANVSKKPTKSISMWMADKVAPAYWQLNSEIVVCSLGALSF
jgi:zinc finger FYVE domain-containing protein 1